MDQGHTTLRQTQGRSLYDFCVRLVVPIFLAVVLKPHCTAASPATSRRVFLRSPSTRVQVVPSVPEHGLGTRERPTSADVLRDNLLADFSPFLGKPLLSWRAFIQQLTQLRVDLQQPPHTHVCLFQIVNGTVSFLPLFPNDTEFTNSVLMKRARRLQEVLDEAQARLTFPDVVFVYNTWDEGACDITTCKLPVFSTLKRWSSTGNVDYQDILLPNMAHHYENLYMYPWEKKRDKALMRASVRSSEGVEYFNRVRVAKMALGIGYKGRDRQRVMDLLDAKVTNAPEELKLPVAPRIKMRDHAQYKYLLSLDGFAASSRLGKLFQSNSLVLKEESDNIEYYYRSVFPGIHYWGFKMNKTDTDLLDILMDLRAGQHNATVQKIIENAQWFASSRLNQEERILYIHEALLLYQQVFDPEALAAMKSTPLSDIIDIVLRSSHL